ncbi:hypothetical protein NW768_002344 [Fusarium equiseti]|uniref:Uncharacterized protein n=1 Tax=Fusarium equiseti TaxID=61235 RepID=A0ABQ8RNF2_FUSEQ|nr:hypothetical protein NW768_002344 [Fusarium equiseti]
MTTPASSSLFKNPSLLRLHLLLVPGSLFVSAAMGYGSVLINAIQEVYQQQNYFNHSPGSLLDLMNATLLFSLAPFSEPFPLLGSLMTMEDVG